MADPTQPNVPANVSTAIAVIKNDLDYIKLALIENQRDNKTLIDNLLRLVKEQHTDHETRIRVLETKDANRRVVAARQGVIIGLITALSTSVLTAIAVALVMKGLGG